MRFSIANHLLYLRVGQPARRLNGHLLLLTRRLVLGAHVDDTVSIDVECDFDLRYATRRRRDTDEIELAENLVVGGHFAFALQHLDADLRLVIRSSGERLALFGRNRGVAVDQTRKHTAEGFNTERKRGDIQEKNILDVAAKDAPLDGGAHGDDFIGVHTLARITAEEFLHDGLHLGHARHTTDEEDFRDFTSGDTRILDAVFARLLGALEETGDEIFKLGTRERHSHVLRASSIGGNERQVNVRGLRRRQFNLGLFRSFAKTLHGELVTLQVDALLLLERGNEFIEENGVEIFTT